MRAAGLARWLAFVAPGRARGTVSLALVADRTLRVLNRRYRGVDQATDVLSFPAEPAARAVSSRGLAPGLQGRVSSAGRPAPGPFLGDIVIACGLARRQARAAGHSESTELRVLALHGLLHLLGYDHERDNGRMRRVEQRLRRKGGVRSGLIERSAATGGALHTP